MKKIELMILALLIILSCSRQNQPWAGLQAGDPAPVVTLTLSDNSVVSTVQDKPLLLSFFHTLCPDCQRELPHLEQISRALQEQLDVCPVSRAQPAAEIEDYWKEQGLTMPYCAQQDRTLYELFAQTGIPKTYLIVGGRIIRVWDDKEELTLTEIEKLL